MPYLESLVNNIRRKIFTPGTEVISMKTGGGTIEGAVYTVTSHFEEENLFLEEVPAHKWAPLMSRFKKANV